ncbi:LptF/LptG family permease [Thermovibrio sp.]
MVKTLDRYVFSKAFKNFALSLITFLTLFAIIDLVSNLELFIKYGFSTGLTYIFGRMPLYAVRVIPIATLVSTMATLSSFSSTSELTVAKALGISIYRFSFPIIALSLLASFFSLTVEETLLPKGLKAVDKIEGIRKEKGAPLNGVWLKNKEGDFIFFWKFEPKTKQGVRVSVIKVEGIRPIERIDCEKALYLGKGKWKLEGVFLRELKSLKTLELKEKVVKLLITPKELLASSISPQELGLIELFITIKRLAKIGYETRYLELELYSKLALALLPVVVALIGIPFGVFNPRNKKGYTVIFAALIIVSMWIVISLFLSLGKSGVLPPSYASFAPLFIFGALGLLLLGRVET